MWYFDYIDMIERIPWTVRLVVLIGLIILACLIPSPENDLPTPTLIETNSLTPTNQPLSDEFEWNLLTVPLLGQ